MAFLEINHIDKTYEDAPLLSDLSLAVDQGEIVSLLGPSGSGKTTLLRMIAGLEPCEGGEILLEGENVSTIPVHRRGIVLMFQEYALFPHQTVAENVAFGLRMRRWSRSDIEDRVREMLDLVGLQDFGRRNVVDLSGGERQRVALARSLAPEPRLLLLDEPLGSLDRNLRERLLEELSAILRRVRITTISVTHDQAEAFALADRVAVLHDAGIVQMDDPEMIYCAPSTPWIARFLGLTNLYPATVIDAEQVSVPWGALTYKAEPSLPEIDTSGTLLVLPWGLHLGPLDDNAGVVGGAVEQDGDSSDAPDNLFTAHVERRIFQGQVTKIVMTLEDAELRLTLEMGDFIPREGDDVRVWIDPQALRWL
jgi:ABC-type Fe3+/spermidine/putrescine transport system ATPase subunit